VLFRSIEVNKNEINKAISYFNSDVFRFLIKISSDGGMALKRSKLKELPHWNENIVLSDNEVTLINNFLKN
jgi:hypothetical protein